MPAHKLQIISPTLKRKVLSVIHRVLGVVRKWWGKRTKAVHSKNFTQLFAIAFGSMMFVVGSYLTITGYIIPKIRALSETTKTMPTDFSFAATGYDNGSGTTYAISTEVKMATAPTWWNASYTKKKDLTVTNLSGNIATAGGTMKISVNTKELFDAGKLLATGDDLRIVYSTQSGTFVELPRALAPEAGHTVGTSVATAIAFPLQVDLLNASSSASYAMYYGNSTASAPSFPKEKYLSFDGVDDRVYFPSNSTNFTAGENPVFSIDFWMKTNSSSYGTYKAVIGSSSSGWNSIYMNSSTSFNYNTHHDTDGGASYSWSVDDKTGLWQHITLIYDRPGGTVTLFQNGVNKGAKAVSKRISRTLYYVGGQSNTNESFVGVVDEVKLFDRVLSNDEIQKLYVGSNVADGLKIYYKFDDGSGQVITDSSGNAKAGTLGGTLSVSSDDPTWINSSLGYSIASKNATLVCPFNGTTTCVGGQTPTTATGAIRYATSSAMVFDGKDDHIDQIPVTISGPYTIEAWFQDKSQLGNWRTLFAFGSYRLTRKNNDYSFQWGGGALAQSGSFTPNQWHHIAIVYDGSSEKMYVDGVAKATRVVTYTNISNLTIARNATEYWSGMIDEFRLSDIVRYSSDFTPQTSPFQSDENTKLLYHFNENGDDPRNTGKVKDASGNGNDGTINGAKYVSGVIGIDSGSVAGMTSPVKNGSFASHEGVFIEEGTTNLITNPSFENSTFNTNWNPSAFTYATAAATFTANLSKRNSAGPFAAGPLVQGKMSGSGTSDGIIINRGSELTPTWYQNYDPNQGSIVFWITPEWNGNDGYNHYIFDTGLNATIRVLKASDNTLRIRALNQSYGVDVSSWIAGNTYSVVLSWDGNKLIDGINHLRISVNDVHSFGGSGTTVVSSAQPNIWIGNDSAISYPANAIIEGLTIYRRVLYDGQYGTDIGNGDEINQIYNGGTGKDPTLVTGSWDVVFALPTNASTGALATGTGNAWSMPHSSNLLGGTNGKNGFMMDGWYGGGDWGVNAPSGSINCGRGNGLNNLHGDTFTAEAWVKIDKGIGNKMIIGKGVWQYGWSINYIEASGYFAVPVFTDGAESQVQPGFSPDNKWHHVALTFDNYSDRRLRFYLDGILTATGEVSTGTVSSDAGYDLMIGGSNNGWARISNNIRYSSNFVPPRIPPVVDGNTIGQWNMSEGLGTTVDNAEGTASRDGLITGGTWERQWSAYSPNKLANGTFETDLAGWSGVPAEDLTVTLDTATKYSGAASAKLVAAGNDANFVQTTNPGNTDQYTFSTFAYTSGAAVTANDVELYYGSSVITPAVYTAIGSTGWYRIDATASGIASNQSAGVRVKAGKTVYVDGFSFVSINQTSSVVALTSASKIFAGGYGVTSQQWGGLYKDITVTAGQDIVVRGIANSDGASQPRIVIYDQTNGTDIGSLNGTTTSTVGHPDNILFTGEAPAGCTTIRVKLVNASETSSVVSWHQVEVYNNLITNPSFESGSGEPWMATGWANFPSSAYESEELRQDTNDKHSGLSSWLHNGNASEYVTYSHTGATSGGYYSVGIFGKELAGTGSGGDQGQGYVKNQATGVNFGFNFDSTSWKYYPTVVRYTNTTGNYYLRGVNGDNKYDDFHIIALDPVSLTVTPASQANSAETSGLRVDGADTLTQPITGLSATNGVIKFKFTPRVGSSIVKKFGGELASPARVPLLGIDMEGSRRDVWQEGNTLFFYSAATDWVSGTMPTLVAGQSYLIEISYSYPGNFAIKVDGVTYVTKQMLTSFSVAPSNVFFGNNAGSITYGGTISNFVTASTTENTTAPYYKFGSKSVKIQAYDQPDQYVTGVTTATNNKNTVTAYVYDGSANNIGGNVDATVATIASGSASLTTSYADMGGGWWRLSYSDTANIPAGTYSYGVQVQAGKTIYVDGVQVEQKAYSTTYADGSLDGAEANYAWNGADHQSTSRRIVSNVKYSANGVFGTGIGSVSFWFSPVSLGGARMMFVNDNGPGSNWNITLTSGSISLGIVDVNNNGRGSVSKNTSFVPGNWYHVTATWDNVNQEVKMCVNSSCNRGTTTGTYAPFTNTFSLTYPYDYYANSSKISDLRTFDQPLTGAEIANIYNSGLQTHKTGVEKIDRYVASGTYTSAPLDLGANGEWGMSPIGFTDVKNGGTVSYETRSSADSITWSSWQAVNGSVIQSDPRRFLQWKATMGSSSDMSQSPVISGMTVSYIEDTTAPVNPDQVALGFSTSSTESADMVSGDWHNFATPKFTWSEALDNAGEGQSASGMAGYHVLLTQNATATPSANTSDNCYEYVGANAREFTVGTSPSACKLTDGTYYLRLQAKDNSGNVATPVTSFTYRYDGTVPKSPASVSSTVIGYTSQNTFTFYWPVAPDQGPSGVMGYEYKTGATSGDYSDWTFTTSTEAPNVTAYQEGQNFFFVRTIDNAGNPSASTSNLGVSPFYYNASAPTAPENVVISPETSEAAPSSSNVFTVSWDKPATYSGEIAKYYYCVNCTPSLLTMTQTTPSETVDRELTNLSLATQQGKNTLYIVAEDNNINSETGKGNVNFEAAANIDFYASTIAPAAPTSLTVSDASDRDSTTWRLTLAWKQPDTGGVPVRYDVFRSDDNGEFVKKGSTTSTAYTDADLSQSTIYYYKVVAIDNAGASSIASNTVNMSPEGKYSTPPMAGGVPAVTSGSSTALVSWTTSREAFGSVEYGKTDVYGSTTSESKPTKSHAVKISGLTPGGTYHFRVQNLDDSGLVGYDRTAAYSGDYSFTTLSSPSVTEVEVTDQTLSSAVVNWSTSSLATSMVEYGLTTAYGTELEVPTNPTDSAHSGRLADLDHSATYHFRIRGTDVDGNDIISDDYTFSTLTYPKVTAMVLNTDQGASGTSVVLAWATNIPTTGEVEYQGLAVDRDGTSSSDLAALASMSQTELARVSTIPKTAVQQAYSGKLENKHVMRLQSLEDGAIYVFTIKGRDDHGNEVVADPIRYVTGNDTRPPVIGNVIIETPMSGVGADAKTSIIVSWDTDEPALGQVMWGAGTGTEYSSATEKDQALTTKHVMVIRDLQPTSSYHLKITSSDKTGNLANSKDTVVVTPTSQQAAFDVILKNLEDVFGFLKL